MGGVFNSIGEGVANLFGAGPQGGPLGGFKPYAQTIDDIAAVAAAPFTGGATLAIPAAFAAEDAAKGNFLGAVGNVAALAGGAYNAGVFGGGADVGAGGASAAGVSGGVGGGAAASAPTDLTGAVSGPAIDASGASVVPAGALPGSFVAGAPVAPAIASAVSPEAGFGNLVAGSGGLTPAVTTPNLATQIGQNLGITPPTQGTNPIGAGGVGAGTGGGSIFSNPLGTIENAFNKNPVGATLAGGGLLYNLISGSNVSGLSALKGEAQGLEGQGAQLASYLNSGSLPPTLQASLDQAKNSAKAQIKSYYASQGMTGSSSELSALQQVDMNAVAQIGQIGSQLLTQGINESQISAQLLEGIVGINQKQQQSTGTSIANLAAALSSGSGSRSGVNIGGLNISTAGT